MSIYNSYRRYLTNRFGKPVIRIPVNGGFSCPNRDGTISTEGCAFCDNRAFSPAALTADDVCRQMTDAMDRHRGRDVAFIPYLQPFSNTYGTVERLKATYEPLLALPGIAGLAVGTRPDCLGADIIAYLADVNRRTCLCVEVGLQSGHDATLLAINRGHTVEDFRQAVRALHAQGIYVAAHVILGLPGEDMVMMTATARLLASLPVDGVKIHQLMIVKGTAFARLHRESRLPAPELERYAETLGAFLAHLRPDQHIHRIMADSCPEHGLIAPLWCTDKAGSITRLQQLLGAMDAKQGSEYRV